MQKLLIIFGILIILLGLLWPFISRLPLGKLPFDPGFVRGGDDGVHRIVSEPDGPSSQAFSEIVAKIQSKVESGSSSGGLEII